MSSLVDSIKSFKEKIISILHKLFEKREAERERGQYDPDTKTRQRHHMETKLQKNLLPGSSQILNEI